VGFHWTIFLLLFDEKMNIDLTTKFNLCHFDGDPKPEKIKKLLNHSDSQKIKPKNSILILEIIKGFTLSEFKIKGPPYDDYEENGQIKTGLLFVTKKKPDPEDFKKFINFNEWNMHEEAEESTLFPDLVFKNSLTFKFFTTDPENYTFKKIFRRGMRLKGNYLTIMFKERYGTSENIEVEQLYLKGKVGFVDSSKIGQECDHQCFKNLLFNEEFSDLKFKVKDTFIPAHKSIISVYSEKLKNLFSENMIELKDFSEDTIRLLLEFLYTQS
jgi:hypothetical protein